MMRTTLMVAAALAVMFAAPAARAEHEGGKGGDFLKKMMEHVDKDTDGKVSKAEFMASQEEHFAKTDADSDGFLTPEEMKAAWEARRQKFREHKEGGKDGGDAAAPAESAPAEGGVEAPAEDGVTTP